MKRLYLASLGLLLCSAMQARELTFYLGDTPVATGSNLSYTNVEIEDFGSFKEVRMEPDLYVSSDIYTTQLSVTATCTSGQMIQLCAGGSCEGGASITKKNIKVQTGQKLPLKFDYVGEIEANEPTPTVTAVIEAQDGDYTETHISFTIVMSEQGSVSVIEGKPEIIITAGNILYNLSGGATLSIYNALGSLVYSEKVKGSGNVALSTLKKGVYFYTLGKKSGKLFIK